MPGYRRSGDGADACLTHVTPCSMRALLPTAYSNVYTYPVPICIIVPSPATAARTTAQMILPDFKPHACTLYAPIKRRSDGPNGKQKAHITGCAYKVLAKANEKTTMIHVTYRNRFIHSAQRVPMTIRLDKGPHVLQTFSRTFATFT